MQAWIIKMRCGSAKPRNLRGWRWLGLTLACFLGWPATRCGAQIATQHEYELKAGCLYNIIKYVEWPSDALSSQPSDIQIGLLGTIQFADVLEQVLNGKTIQGHKLVVKRISGSQEAANCQVLFIGRSEKERLAEIISEVKNRPVLTVGEVEGFAEMGGMVNLVSDSNRIMLEINHKVARDARLRLSSQMLKVAKLVPR